MFKMRELYQAFLDYVQRRDNPHQINSNQVGAFDKPTLDSIADNYLDGGTFSVTKYGDNLWQPPTVLGSFGGGQRYENWGYCTMIQEPSGEICMLEAATSGLRVATYYTFFTYGDIVGIGHRPTPSEYAPPYITRDDSTARVTTTHLSDGNSVIWGVTRNDTGSGYYVALTFGSGEPGAHVGCTLTNGAAINSTAYAFVHGAYVYWIFATGGDARVSMWRVAIADILAGGPVTAGPVVGWSGITLGGAAYTDSGIIRLCASYYSVDEPTEGADVAMFLPGSSSRANHGQCDYLVASHPAENKIRVVLRTVNIVYFKRLDGLTTYQDLTPTFVLDIDLDVFHAEVIPETRFPYVADFRNTNNPPHSGQQVTLNAKYGGALYGNRRGPLLLTDHGDVWNMNFPNEGPAQIRYGKCGTGREVTRWDKLHPDNANWSYVSSRGGIGRQFGSAVGGSMRYIGALPNNRIHVYTETSTSNTNPSVVGRNVLVTNAGRYDDFTYQGDGAQFQGFAPTEERRIITVGVNDSLMPYAGVCSGDDKRILSASGPTMVESSTGAIAVRTVAAQVISGQEGTLLATGGTFTIQPGVLLTAGVSVIPAYADALGGGDNITTIAELWIPKGNRRTYPAIMFVLLHRTTNGSGVHAAYNVDVTFQSGSVGAGGVISAVTVVNRLSNRVFGANSISRTNITGNITANFIYEHTVAGDLKYSLLQTPSRLIYFSLTGQSHLRYVVGLQPTETRYTPTFSLVYDENVWYWGTASRTVVERVGMVSLNQAMNRAGGGAVLMYYKHKQSDVLADVWAEQTDGNTNYVLLSSQLPAGFSVYFAESVDSLIDSVYHLVQPITVDLSTISPDPANKRFHVYLDVVNGAAVYVISEQQSVNHKLYIGYIDVGATQITNIHIVKATKFGW